MRKRLTLALVGLVAGALVLAGAGALLVGRASSRHVAAGDLLREATALSSSAGAVRGPRAARLVDAVLRREGGRIVVVGPRGEPLGAGAAGLPPALFGPAVLAAGGRDGWQGSLAYAAVPVTAVTRLTVRLPAGDRLVVVLTETVGTLAPGWLYLFVVGGITLVAAAVVAAWLARRISRPLAEVSEATARLAAGDLSARVPERGSTMAELDRLTASVNAMAAGLAAAREREALLLASVSHDLRTPLTSIRGYAEALEEGVAEDVPAAARVISREARRLERLVADLLEIGKARALSLDLRPVDAHRVVTEVVAGFGAQAGGRVLTVAGTAPAMVLADEDRLGQVVGNLIDNALAHARSSVEVRVEAGTVTVTDDGPGIPPESLARVFDRFYQADRGRGSGLGLTIVAELVRSMDGTVEATSPVSSTGGSRFTVRLQPSA